MDSQLAPSGFLFVFILSSSFIRRRSVSFCPCSSSRRFCDILGARIVLWEGSLRSCLDRPWRREAPLFLLEVSGPFPLLSFEAPSFATGLEGCPAAPPSAGGVRTGVLQSAGHTRPMICKALLVMALCSFSIYVFIRCFPCRLKGSFLLSFCLASRPRRAVRARFRFSDRSRRRRSARSPAVVVVAAVGAFDLGARGALFCRRV